MSILKIRGIGMDNVIILMFLASLMFFLLQHAIGLSWDFSAYVLNAKYWTGESQYFEWMRPPLTSFILLMLSIFGWPFTEYAFIIFVSILFLGACLEFSKAFSVNNKIFYAFMLAPVVLAFGFSDGSELLALSLLMLSISSLHSYEDERKAGLIFGLFFALAFLCRYDAVVFFPVVFIQKPDRRVAKELLLSIAMFVIVVSPWLAYNYLVSGNWLTSMEDLYAINIKFRGYMNTPPNTLHIIAASAYYLPLLLLGTIKRRGKFETKDAAMIFIFIIVIISYILKPTKTPRYLLDIVLPLSYLSTYFVQVHFKRYMEKIEDKLAVLILALNLVLILPFVELTGLSMYGSIASHVERCRMDSNGWVFLNYYGMLSEPHPWDANVGKELEEGKRLLLFKRLWDPSYSRSEEFLSQFPTIENTEDYVLLGNVSVCLPPEPYTKTYLRNYAENSNIGMLGMTNCEILLSGELCKKYWPLEALI